MFFLLRGIEPRHVIRCVAVSLVVITGIGNSGHALSIQPQPSSEAIPPLVQAIWSQDIEKVKQLLADGADPDVKTASGGNRPAWVWAITARDQRATELLLSQLTTVNRAEALLVAANRNDLPLAQTLFAKGMPVDARAIDGATALLVAAASGHVDTLRLLLERGASVNLADDHRDTALMAAVRAGSLESVKLLLTAGAEANVTDQAGRTALTWATRSRRPDVIAALRASGARGDTSELPRVPLTPRAAVEHSLPLIQRGTETWNELQSCGACHHHPLMFRATAIAKRQGFAVDAGRLEPQLERMRRGTARRAPALTQALASAEGVLRWSLRTGGDISFGNAWFLSSFADAGLRWPLMETRHSCWRECSFVMDDGGTLLRECPSCPATSPPLPPRSGACRHLRRQITRTRPRPVLRARRHGCERTRR
jgi:hypothetical protein